MFAQRTTAPSTRSLLLVPFGRVRASELARLERPLRTTLRCTVQVHAEASETGPVVVAEAGRPDDAAGLMAALLARFPEHRGKVVGVTDTDLFVPGLAWIFGQAQLQGRVAVVSTHRLAEQYHARAPDPLLELSRLYAEICHEVGHTFGLPHCRLANCLMNWCATVDEIDARGLTLCRHCSERLEQARPEPAPSAVAFACRQLA